MFQFGIPFLYRRCELQKRLRDMRRAGRQTDRQAQVGQLFPLETLSSSSSAALLSPYVQPDDSGAQEGMLGTAADPEIIEPLLCERDGGTQAMSMIHRLLPVCPRTGRGRTSSSTRRGPPADAKTHRRARVRHAAGGGGPCVARTCWKNKHGHRRVIDGWL